MPQQNRTLKPDKTFSQDLSLAALAYTTAFGRRFRLEQILFKASVAITEVITITLDSVNGSNYDTVLGTIDLVGETDAVFRPQGDANFQIGDEIKIDCTNANTTGIIRGMVKASELTQ